MEILSIELDQGIFYIFILGALYPKLYLKSFRLFKNALKKNLPILIFDSHLQKGRRRLRIIISQ